MKYLKITILVLFSITIIYLLYNLLWFGDRPLADIEFLIIGIIGGLFLRYFVEWVLTGKPFWK